MDPYDVLAEFLARGPTSQEIVDHHLEEGASVYLENLIRKEKNSRLTDAEYDCVERFMQVDHLMTLVKAKARRLLREEAERQATHGEQAQPVAEDAPVGDLAAA